VDKVPKGFLAQYDSMCTAPVEKQHVDLLPLTPSLTDAYLAPRLPDMSATSLRPASAAFSGTTLPLHCHYAALTCLPYLLHAFAAFIGTMLPPRCADMPAILTACVCCCQWYYAATTLRSETTGAGQDLMLVAGPESVSSYVMEADSRRCHTVPSCKGHTGPCVSVQVS
jgi:hypothetical protein